ncbi:hypothetical protein OUZ56_012112 [Daphnia magna]|uniref:Uncharacterized protein n=1 Tax=Daphnia magna TaxID=35525 RepID=A0ABQ9Z233_9CRUS|nr:hypothetical protein OUZ56_012112 [Daphnia magna]
MTSATRSLDTWSSKRMCGYIVFSLEGVTINYEQFTAFLSLRQMTGRHTKEAILTEFEDVDENAQAGQDETGPLAEDFTGEEEEMIKLVLDSEDSDSIVELP